ncbi:F-box protein At5g49610-like [Cryptomeria japonica]|uniref:F-box protein At5g49610-like n=1 Tax=Cryptomeria japonica TaxID=3369 RepID=UPI0027DA99E2|nr:F-box protein At5g49610-like [Cryptomeria japonica]
MDVQVWSKLPEELLMRNLSDLPSLIMRKFVVVCKSWRTQFQQSQLSVPLSLFPAFLIGSLHSHNDYDNLYLLQSPVTYPLRKLSLDFLATSGHVVTTCKSLLCYVSYPRSFIFKDTKSSICGPSDLFSICNPITRTWKRLPPPIQLRSDTHFIAMSFDPCARRCLLVIGVNNNTGGDRNQLVMEIFDSQSSTWTKLEMDMPLSVFPKGEGLYSRGSFYWINYNPLDQSSRPMFRYDVAAYNVAENRWDVIRRPETGKDIPEFEYHCCWKLTGYDGKVVMVDQIDMSLWELNIEGCEGPS